MTFFYCHGCKVEHREYSHITKNDRKPRWYKTSPHDDRWGSFNPLNMDWWTGKLLLGCGFYLLLAFVAGCEGVLEWVT